MYSSIEAHQAQSVCLFITLSYICYFDKCDLLTRRILIYTFGETVNPLCACHESMSASNFGSEKGEQGGR